MKPERTEPENPSPSGLDAVVDESPTAKVRRLRPVKTPYAWDPFEVWRTRVKPKGEDETAQ
jgi:hypothetical protein